MYSISLIIPNWNGEKFLRGCLNSIKKQTIKDFEVIVVDNGSDDNSIDFIKTHYPEFHIIQLPFNKGFSVGINEGINHAEGEYIALINNDVELKPNWLEEIKKGLDENTQIGSCASKMLNFNNRELIDSAGDGYSSFGYGFKIGNGELDNGKYNLKKEVFGACAGAAIYRRSLFEKTGLFDEDFFAVMEDVDLSFRAQLYGFKCMYIPSAIVYHIGNATIGKDSPAKIFFSTKNNINVIVKNFPFLFLISNLPRILYGQLRLFIFFFLGGRVSPFLKGVLSALRQLPLMIKKRREIQGRRCVTINYLRSIIDIKNPILNDLNILFKKFNVSLRKNIEN